MSCENCIVLWEPGRIGESELKIDSPVSVIQTFELKDCKIWLIRFSYDHFRKSCENCIVLWEPGRIGEIELKIDSPVSVMKTFELKDCKIRSKCTTTIRQTALSPNGNVLLCCCDDGTIWRWDKVPA